MFQLLALLTGVTLAVMISVNGSLAACYDAYTSAAIIHLAGSLAALLLCLVRRERVKSAVSVPWWVYLGGPVGVLTTLFQNYAFSRISMTSLVALGLLGQTVAALLVDAFGLFGMAKRPLRKSSLISLAFAAAGILVMLDSSVGVAIAAVALAMLSGVCVVVSRTMNSRLADRSGALLSALAAHVTGLALTVALALVLASGTAFQPVAAGAARPWIYVGGLMGVMVIVLCNVTVPRLPAFRLTLLTFVGQIFTGVLIDLLLGNAYANSTFTGGLVIAAGIALNMLFDGIFDRRKTLNKS